MRALGLLVTRFVGRVPIAVRITRTNSKIYRNPQFAELRNMVKVEYECSKCKSENAEILLSDMYKNQLVMLKCSTCKTGYCLGDQLQWFREVCSKNPELLKQLKTNGDLVTGILTPDFETDRKESKVVKKIMKRDDAPEMIGIEYHESNITKQIDVHLLRYDMKMQY